MKITPIINYSTFFKGGLRRPLTQYDYERAKKYCKEKGESEKPAKAKLEKLDEDKLNGIQKGIKVFEGLSMKDISEILRHGYLLLNRGCNNNCAHCGYSAAPYSIKTQDRMSWEDLCSLVEGIKELKTRMGSQIATPVWLNRALFIDSDCINVEIYDKKGNSYDYVDCVKKIAETNPRYTTQYDTSGWNPKNDEHQKRAEKLVNYMLSPNNKISQLYISLNPYHVIYAKAQSLKEQGEGKKAKKLEKKYYERMANVMFTLTPLVMPDKKINYRMGFLTRAIDSFQTDTTLDEDALKDIIKNVLNKLEKMYFKDLMGERKFVKSKKDIKDLMYIYKDLIEGCDSTTENILPLGRAQNLFIEPSSTLEKRKTEFLGELKKEKNKGHFALAINPDGSVVTFTQDVSAKTDISLNFEKKGEVKPLGSEIENFVYII